MVGETAPLSASLSIPAEALASPGKARSISEVLASSGEALSIPGDALLSILGTLASSGEALSIPAEAPSMPVEAVASAGEALASEFRAMEPLSAPFGAPGATLPLQLGTKANAPQATATVRARRAAFIGAAFIGQRQPNRSTVSGQKRCEPLPKNGDVLRVMASPAPYDIDVFHDSVDPNEADVKSSGSRFPSADGLSCPMGGAC